MSCIEDVLDKLRALCERSLSDGEFSFEHNLELQEHSDTLSKKSSLENWLPAVFEIIEQYDDKVDLTLGSPGPLVHALESKHPEYQEYLIASLVRKPTGTTVWMADRIARSPDEKKEFWEQKIKTVLSHPDATLSAREIAEGI